MATWRVTDRPACGLRVPLIQDVEADQVYDHGHQITPYGRALVMEKPRQVIALRRFDRAFPIFPLDVVTVEPSLSRAADQARAGKVQAREGTPKQECRCTY
jgi:hypothetical protein